MAIRVLRRGHSFALTYPNGINYVTLAVNDLISAALGAGIAAIQLHFVYLRKGSMPDLLRFIN